MQLTTQRFFVGASLIFLVGAAHADINVSLTPGDLALNGAIDAGTATFGYDPAAGAGGFVNLSNNDFLAEGSFAAGGAPGFGNSSWYSNVQGSAAIGGLTAPSGRPYASLLINPTGLFQAELGRAVKLSDLASISYYTNYESGVDWSIRIYTKNLDYPNTPGWYANRFGFTDPQLVTPDGLWHEHSTSTDLSVVSAHNKATNSYFALPATTLAGLAGSSYGDQEILRIDIVASYYTNSPPSYSYLDGIKITLSDANATTANIDLVAVPAPGAALLALLGMPIVGWVKRRMA